jgi:hypothetical protein
VGYSIIITDERKSPLVAAVSIIENERNTQMAANSDNTPATKADLESLEQRLDERFAQFDRSLEQRLDQRFAQFEDKLIETMRDMQTELLRGFAAHIDGLTVRMRKIEADQNNLDAATSPRLALLEQQVTQMNIRLMKLEMR